MKKINSDLLKLILKNGGSFVALLFVTGFVFGVKPLLAFFLIGCGAVLAGMLHEPVKSKVINSRFINR